MTGDEIISLARSHFGEAQPLTVTADEDLAFLNAALIELYSDLPVDRMKSLIQTSVVDVSDNRGNIENTWDRVIDVYVEGQPAVQVPPEVIQNTDRGDLFAPGVPIYYVDSSHLWVRPVNAGEASVVYLNPPTAISAESRNDPVTQFTSAFHPALADLITSYMYAQEEDVQQAEYFRNAYQAKLVSLIELTQAEAS